MSEYCFICDGSLSVRVTTKVKTRGIEKFVKSSDERKDGKAERHLRGMAEISVHEKCRKAYTNVKSIKAAVKRFQDSGNSALQLSQIVNVPGSPFAFGTKCLFCEADITEVFLEQQRRKSKDKRVKVFKVKNRSTQWGILKAAAKCDDDSSTRVM